MDLRKSSYSSFQQRNTREPLSAHLGRQASTAGRSVEASGPTTQSNANDDPFLLDFGTSVNVNEDLRRVIKTEIQEIDDAIVSARGATKSEQTVEGQLKKDLTHSHREMADITRGASEQLETSNVHASLLGSLQKTLHGELVANTITAPTGIVETSSTHDDGNSSGPSKAPPVETSASQSNREVLQGLSDRLKNITSAMKSSAEEIDNLVLQQNNVKEKSAMIEASMETDALPSLLENKRKEIAVMQAEIDKENQRQKATKAATQKSRANSGKHAQAVADKTKELDSLRRDIMETETKSSEQVDTAKAQLAERQKGKAAKEAELADLSSKLAYCSEVEDEITQFMATCTAKAKRSQDLLDENAALRQTLAELTSRLEAANEELEKGKLHLDTAKKAVDVSASLVSANDEFEKSVVVPGKIEMAQLIVQKEQLAKTISQGHEERVTAQERENEEQNNLTGELRAATAELRTLKEDLEGKRLKKQHFDRVQQEAKENWEREIGEHIALEEKFRLAYEAELKHNEDTHQSKKKEYDDKLEQMKSESALRCAAVDRHLHILMYGADIIQHGEETERHLKEDPITI